MKRLEQRADKEARHGNREALEATTRERERERLREALDGLDAKLCRELRQLGYLIPVTACLKALNSALEADHDQ